MTPDADRDSSSSTALVLDHVAKSYDGLAPVLLDLSLEVPEGQFVSVIGPSGCGKSTLLRIIAGLESPDAGTVLLFGRDVAASRKNKAIGYVPQSLALLAWRTVLENVQLPLEVGGTHSSGGPTRDPKALLSSFGLASVLDRRPSELSGGMRQRVAIARALVSAPSLLLLDEPFSSLDEITREVLRHELLELWQDAPTTVVFVTHSVTEAVLLSDSVVVLGARASIAPVAIAIDLARPRGDLVELTSGFIELERKVRLALRR